MLEKLRGRLRFRRDARLIRAAMKGLGDNQAILALSNHGRVKLYYLDEVSTRESYAAVHWADATVYEKSSGLDKLNVSARLFSPQWMLDALSADRDIDGGLEWRRERYED